LLGLITAYCAAMTSVGLALATWISRLGRAVALCVSAYVVFSIGWAIFTALLGASGSGTAVIAMLLGSPLFGTAIVSAIVITESGPSESPDIEVIGLGAMFWIIVFGLGALFLFEATVTAFDRRLRGITDAPGRLTLPERTGKPVRRRPYQTR
jgi:hypothetical protein